MFTISPEFLLLFVIVVFLFCLLPFLFANLSGGDLRVQLAEMNIVDSTRGKDWLEKSIIFKPGYAGVDPCHFLMAFRKLRRSKQLLMRTSGNKKYYKLA